LTATKSIGNCSVQKNITIRTQFTISVVRIGEKNPLPIHRQRLSGDELSASWCRGYVLNCLLTLDCTHKNRNSSYLLCWGPIHKKS